jgi:hypothetical protein
MGGLGHWHHGRAAVRAQQHADELAIVADRLRIDRLHIDRDLERALDSARQARVCARQIRFATADCIKRAAALRQQAKALRHGLARSAGQLNR